jgi:hypothetical protein
MLLFLALRFSEEKAREHHPTALNIWAEQTGERGEGTSRERRRHCCCCRFVERVVVESWSVPRLTR